MKSAPDNLDEFLHGWSELPAPTGRLAGPVWQRIEAEKARPVWFGSFIFWLRDLDTHFARPYALAAIVALGVFVGLGAAEARSLYNARQIDNEMSARYLSMLDVSGR